MQQKISGSKFERLVRIHQRFQTERVFYQTADLIRNQSLAGKRAEYYSLRKLKQRASPARKSVSGPSAPVEAIPRSLVKRHETRVGILGEFSFVDDTGNGDIVLHRSEEHTSELQSL